MTGPAASGASTTAPPFRQVARRFLLAAGLALLLGLWWQAGGVALARSGLFTRIGLDFGHYWAQATVLRYAEPARIYDVERVGRNRLNLLRNYAPVKPSQLHPSLTPYPPLFAWLTGQFLRLSPPRAFLAWTMLNLALALALGWLAAGQFPAAARGTVVLVTLAAYPVGFSVFLGQVQLLLAIALGACFLALRQGRELHAGLWLGLAVLKPQYALLFSLMLAWKRRWRAIGGALLSTTAIFLGSLLVAGLEPLRRYPGAVLWMGDWDAAEVPILVNLRSLIVRLWPGTIEPPGLAGPVALLALTAAAAALAVCRGPVEPTSPRFPLQVSALLAAPMLGSLPMYGYSPAVLLVPLAAAWAEGSLSRWTRCFILSGALLSTVSLATAGAGGTRFDPAWWRAAAVVAACLPLVYLGLLADLTRTARPGATAPATGQRPQAVPGKIASEPSAANSSPYS